MHGHHDSDHYDVQFTTRQLVMLFGLLIVIVVGVFVGGIVIGRGMAPDAAEAMMARRTSPVPAPPAAKAAPASVAEAPEEDTLRLPIRSEPTPAGRTAARAPARETTARDQPARAARPATSAPARATPAARPPARTASTSPEQLANRTQAAPEPRAANPAPSRAADRPQPAASGKFTIQVAAFRDRAAAERMLEQLAARGIEGYLEGTPAGIFRVRVGQFESREAARDLAARLESEQFATLVTSR
ncbi:MAG: SPOR domain-containing protein [Acidobacteria bacterium]|nr:SPOR domain-containing protein [Acidobacteriota bacterium]MYA45376.1 SPOR domain-containing protein [Acidobacteriota bacterium]MYI38498.1 SPOR domain-containing protein [Acidobacteriota bacterium]